MRARGKPGGKGQSMNPVEMLKKYLLEHIEGLPEVQALVGQLRSMKGIGDVVANALTLSRLVGAVVLLVERGSKQLMGFVADLQGEDKQKAAAEALDALVPLPWFLEWADGPIFKFLIGLAVQKLNAEHGHDWSGVDVLREAGVTRGLSTYERGLVEEITGIPAPIEPRPATKEDAATIIEAWREGQEPPADVTARVLGTPEPAPTSQVALKTRVAAAPAKPRFETCLSVVLGFEGGYSNNPNDKGGATNLGITAGTLARAHKAGVVGHNDVKRLTRTEAAAIYRRFYWDPIGGDRLPAPLDLILFDAAVNCGVGAAVKHLQEALNALLPGNPLVVDGGYGPKTREALETVIEADRSVTQTCRGLEPHALLRYLALDALMNKVELYDALADKSPSQRTFLRGWVHNRAVALETKAGMEG